MADLSSSPSLLLGIKQSLVEYKKQLTSQLEHAKARVVADTDYEDEKALVQFTSLRATYKRVAEQIQSFDTLDEKPPVARTAASTSQSRDTGVISRSASSPQHATPKVVSRDLSESIIDTVFYTPRPGIIDDSQTSQEDSQTLIGDSQMLRNDQSHADQSTPNARSSVDSNEAPHSCRTCRARRVKCDRQQPTCSTCARAGRECGGYELMASDVRDDSTISTKPQLAGSSAGNSQPASSDTLQGEESDAPAVKYIKDDMALYFPEDDIIYDHIVELKDKAIELNCPLCNANCTPNGKYFNGVGSFLGHVRKHDLPDLKSVQEIFEEAAAKDCLREVAEDDIERIRQGEKPVGVRGPDKGDKRKTLILAGVRDAQPFDQHRSSAVSTPVKKGVAIYKGSSSPHKSASPLKSALKRPAPEYNDNDDNDLDNSENTITVAPRKTGSTSTGNVLQDLASNALALAHVESSGGRGKRQKKRTVRFDERATEEDWYRVLREAEQWDNENGVERLPDAAE